MQKVKITQIKQNPDNPRIIKDDKYSKLLNSIKEFPDMLNKRPLIVVTDIDGKYIVLGGNMRLKALKELKYKEVPIIVADEWTEEERKQFIIEDNVSFGEWDFDRLANEWDVADLTRWGLEIKDYDIIENDNEELSTIDDINFVDEFNESINFIIKCENLEQLEQLQSKLNTDAQKMGYKDFILKTAL